MRVRVFSPRQSMFQLPNEGRTIWVKRGDKIDVEVEPPVLDHLKNGNLEVLKIYDLQQAAKEKAGEEFSEEDFAEIQEAIVDASPKELTKMVIAFHTEAPVEEAAAEAPVEEAAAEAPVEEAAAEAPVEEAAAEAPVEEAAAEDVDEVLEINPPAEQEEKPKTARRSKKSNTEPKGE